jgi:hypothetical protein
MNLFLIKITPLSCFDIGRIVMNHYPSSIYLIFTFHGILIVLRMVMELRLTININLNQWNCIKLTQMWILPLRSGLAKMIQIFVCMLGWRDCYWSIWCLIKIDIDFFGGILINNWYFDQHTILDVDSARGRARWDRRFSERIGQWSNIIWSPDRTNYEITILSLFSYSCECPSHERILSLKPIDQILESKVILKTNYW